MSTETRIVQTESRQLVSETVSYGWIEGNLFAKKTFLEEETRAFDETRMREI